MTSDSDRELDAVLVALAPLGWRAMCHIDPARRSVDFDEIRETVWSTGERFLVEFAEACWTGRGKIDLGSAMATLDGRFFRAFLDAFATRTAGTYTADCVSHEAAVRLWDEARSGAAEATT